METFFCTKCGAKLSGNVKFCVMCGASIQNSSVLKSEVPIQEPGNGAGVVKKEALLYFAQAQKILSENESKKNYPEIINLFEQAALHGNAEAELWIDICKLYQFIDALKENSLKRLQRNLQVSVITSESITVQEKERVVSSIDNNQKPSKNPAEWNIQYDSKSTSSNNSTSPGDTFSESAGKVVAGAIVGAAAHQLLQKDQQGVAYAESVTNSSMMTTPIDNELGLSDLQFLATVTPEKIDPDEVDSSVQENSGLESGDSNDDGGIVESIFDFLDNV